MWWLLLWGLATQAPCWAIVRKQLHSATEQHPLEGDSPHSSPHAQSDLGTVMASEPLARLPAPFLKLTLSSVVHVMETLYFQ